MTEESRPTKQSFAKGDRVKIPHLSLKGTVKKDEYSPDDKAWRYAICINHGQSMKESLYDLRWFWEHELEK